MVFASARPSLDFLRSAGAVCKAALATDHDHLEPLTRRRSSRPAGGGTSADRHHLRGWTRHLVLGPVAALAAIRKAIVSGTGLSSTAGRPAHDHVLVGAPLGAVFGSLLLLLFLFVFRAMFRRLWLAAAALIVLMVVVSCPNDSYLLVVFDVLISCAGGVHPDPIRSIGADGRDFRSPDSSCFPSHRGFHHMVRGQLSFRDRQRTRADCVRLVHRPGRATLVQGRIP